MKKILVGIILTTLITAPTLVIAIEEVPEMSPEAFLQILGDVVGYLFTILLIVAAIFLVIAGFNFVTASGEPDKIAKAKTFVIYALVGVAVAVASRGLIALVREVMGA